MDELINVQDMCRICLNKRETIEVMDTRNFSRKRYIGLIKECASCNEIILDENLPDYVCIQCYKVLDTYYDFRLQLIASEEKLLRLLQKPKGLIAANENIKEVEVFETTDYEVWPSGDGSELNLNTEILSSAEVNTSAESKQKLIIKEHMQTGGCDVKDEPDDGDVYQTIDDRYGSDDASEQNLKEENLTEIEPNEVIPIRIGEKDTDEKKTQIVEFELKKFPNGLYKCKICSLIYLSLEDLETHKYKEHRYECKVCLIELNNSEELEEHAQTHAKSSKFICKFCGKSLAQKPNLINHWRVHTGERPFLCNDCGKSFKYHKSLHDHLKSHTGIKPLKCETCGDYFATYRLLISHQDLHKTEREFKCNFCDKSFIRKSSHRLHEQTHTTEPNLQCQFCSRKYRSQYERNRHEKEVHIEYGKHCCHVCHKVFIRKRVLRLHLKTHSGKKTI